MRSFLFSTHDLGRLLRRSWRRRNEGEECVSMVSNKLDTFEYSSKSDGIFPDGG
jgi:hypothetical protein